MKKIIYLICLITFFKINSQNKKESTLYDVNKVYIQLNDFSGEIVFVQPKTFSKTAVSGLKSRPVVVPN